MWVFGYGSLMWRPGFPHRRAVTARLTGYHRGFCIYSTHHRGSADRPGLVLGLDRGGSCTGMAFEVSAEHERATRAYLSAREQVNGVYRVAHVTLDIIDHSSPAAARTAPERVLAMAYIVERSHPSYAGDLPLSEQSRLIRAARGISGCNLDYLINTVRELRRSGIREAELERLLVVSGPHFSRGSATSPSTPGARALRLHCASTSVAAPRLRPWQRRRFTHRKQIASLAAQKD
jgi:cation transport protein ChaC